MPESQKAQTDARTPNNGGTAGGRRRGERSSLKSVSSPSVLSIKLPDEVARVVRDLAEGNGITATEVLRRGVALEQFVTQQLNEGGVFLIKRPDGTTERVHFVFA